MERITAHEAYRLSRRGLGLLHQAAEGFFTVDQPHFAALDLVKTQVQYLARLGQLIEITYQGIFDQFVAGPFIPGINTDLIYSGIFPRLFVLLPN